MLDLCKQANQYLTKFRIMVEHIIGLIKLFKIVANKHLNRRQRYDRRMKLFAGIVNFKLSLWLLQEVYCTSCFSLIFDKTENVFLQKTRIQKDLFYNVV